MLGRTHQRFDHRRGSQSQSLVLLVKLYMAKPKRTVPFKVPHGGCMPLEFCYGRNFDNAFFAD